MAAARAVQIIPHSPIAFTYSRCRRLHQELRQKILDYRAAPRNSLPPPKPTFLAVEPAPTFLLGSSAAKYDPSETTGSLAERFWYGIWDRRGDFYDKKNPYRLGTAHTWKQRRGDDLKRDATVFTCNAEVAKRLDGDLSTYVGPGQILAWLVLDLRLITLLGCTKDHVERAERRQIADVQVSVEDDILSACVILNVENPIGGHEQIDPWCRLEAADIEFNPVTSIAVEAGQLGHELGHVSTSFRIDYTDLLRLRLLGVFNLRPVEMLDYNTAFGDISKSIDDEDWFLQGGLIGFLVAFLLTLVVIDLRTMVTEIKEILSRGRASREIIR
ncbi:hypothetical protein F4820DRAFT_466220 [Hypoxylon rubiginosum]|uniref:Uncharacterized protein n=1 Tax=Hypoxylon rubiginosum TaxID=110542 RepID=A0ACB9YLS8_9PEZI|nr:hypothetical protein F4820DRAFT_466220 [Hypoxylon rubiginosum]